MTDSWLSLAERERIRLRSAMADMDLQLRGLLAVDSVAGHSKAAAAVEGSWQELVVLLALPPEPERRTCPACQQRIMRLATRCVYCWKKSPAE